MTIFSIYYSDKPPTGVAKLPLARVTKLPLARVAKLPGERKIMPINSDDCISREGVICTIKDLYIKCDTENMQDYRDLLLEDKILAIGYTGKEGRIYIGGRLFAVRELAQ